MLQQLLYADEVRSLKDLDIEKVARLAGRAEAGAAADRPDLRGHLRPDAVRGRGEEAHPRRDRREDRRQGDRRRRRRTSRAGRPGDRPDGGAARQPEATGQRRRRRRRPRPRPAEPTAGQRRRLAKERKGVRRAAKAEEPAAAGRARAQAVRRKLIRLEVDWRRTRSAASRRCWACRAAPSFA